MDKRRLTAIPIYLPALILWIPFALLYSLANKLCRREEAQRWTFFNVTVSVK